MIGHSHELISLDRMRTRLNCFSDQKQGPLINWGYALTDPSLRFYVLDPGVPAGNRPVLERPL